MMLKFRCNALKTLKTIVLSVALCLCGPLANAQTTSNTLTKKQIKQLELDQINEELEQAKQRQEKLAEEIAGYDKDIGAINRALIETAKNGQSLEAKVSIAEGKLTIALKEQDKIRASLTSKRSLLSEVLGALQRMGRKPPPAILVKPEDALASVRSAILLGSVVPQIRSQTKILFLEIQALAETTRKVERNKTELTSRLNALAEDETRLTLLVSEKNQLTQRSSEELQKERELASKLAAEATSLGELITTLEDKIASAAEVAAAARAADLRRQKREDERLANARKQLQSGKAVPGNQSVSDTTRIEPEISFSKAKGKVLYPVSGKELYGFGSKAIDGFSTNQSISPHASSNIAFTTRPNARVRTPADGWVLYAGKFRSYGQLLILNAGDGYHIVLAGLAQVNVAPGRFVLAGEPVGRMGATRVASALTTDLGSNRPVLYVEFRKDGKSIDPAPWWAPRAAANAGADG